MLIAVLLALFVITSDSPDAKERFAHGKEVLTILIGVFGTILGFYFGKADVPQTTPNQVQDSRPDDTIPRNPPARNPDVPADETNGGGDASNP